MRTAAGVQLSVFHGGDLTRRRRWWLSMSLRGASSLRGRDCLSVLPALGSAQSSHTFGLELSQNPVRAASCDSQEAWEARPCSFPVRESGVWSFAGA